VRTVSLGNRLLALAAVWILLALAAAGLVLTDLFRQHAEAELAGRMEAHLDELTAALEVQPDGQLAAVRPLSEPRFQRPLSGLYWQVAGPAGRTLRSRSLWDEALALPDDRPQEGELHRHALTGAGGAALSVWERSLRLPGVEGPVRVAVAADLAAVRAATAGFSRVLALSLAVLAAGLLAAAVAQVHFGLVPLRRMGAALKALRRGRAERVAGEFPAEVRPLVEDLNQLLADNAAMVARARAQAADLAHALKTPLAVIANAAAGPGGDTARTIAGEAERMRRQIDRHLARARAAGRRRGAAVPALATLAPLARAIGQLHAGRDLDIRIDGDAALTFQGDGEDLQEMAGNLIDNAGKWAAHRVRVALSGGGGRLRLTVEDDGPGIAAARRASLPARGERLDESMPGSGLGLAITDELARLYGGSLELSESALGGLRATLDLPGGG
jgi:signal transduction histidine kinase